MPLISLHPTEASTALTAPLVIVVPVYNEAQTIKKVVKDWQTTLDSLDVNYQFLLINDGSKDATLLTLTELETADPTHLVIIDKPNAGHGRTCRLGYDAAVGSPHVEWVLQIDSDGQCDPSYFPEFWKQRLEADCVFGRRVQRDDGLARAMTSKICKLGSMLLSGKDMGDPNVPYRLIRKEVLANALKSIPASFDIHNVALTFVLKQTPSLRWNYVPIRFLERQGGRNSIGLLNVTHLGTSMLFDLAKLKRRPISKKSNLPRTL